MLLLADIPSLSWSEALLRIVVAAVLGGAVGLERELRDREAGFRTHMLVSIGSALFTIVSAYAFRDFLVEGGAVVRADPTRIAAQIVTGIGFLGAGAIIRQGLSIRGLTTAATLWVVAAIGMAAGAGYYGGAVITTAVVLISLWPLRILAHHVTAGSGRRRAGSWPSCLRARVLGRCSTRSTGWARACSRSRSATRPTGGRCCSTSPCRRGSTLRR